MNFFDLFDIEKDLKIDKAGLKKTFYALNKKYHPDFHTQQDEEGQWDSMDMTMQINEGLKVLSDIDLRIKYILKIKEVNMDEKLNALPQSFLMEMMDINEALMDAKMEGDEAGIVNAKAGIEAFMNTLAQSFESLKKRFIFDQVSVEDLEELKMIYFKRKYLKRLKQQIS